MAKKKTPTIIVDYDDTVVSFLGHLCHVHNRIHGTSLHVNDIMEWDITSVDTVDARGKKVKGKDLLKTFQDYESHGLYAQLPLLPHAGHAMRLMRKLGYKIIIMTARRPEFELQTRLNVIYHCLPLDKIIFTKEKAKEIRKLQRSHNIVLFADDKLSTVEDVNENCKVDNTFLIDMKHNRDVELDEGIIRIENLFEAVRYLKDVS